ncbi:MAG: shikimate kinase [Nanoarchaeota archaeon]|nr:shikimate kinase [Nanoarchaeota archaeon]
MNITLIGMPAVGKSFFGKALAEKIKYNFIDIDKLIEESKCMSIQSIIDNFGEKELLKKEENQTLNLKVKNTVIAPGGSAIYSDKAMNFLKKTSDNFPLRFIRKYRKEDE